MNIWYNEKKFEEYVAPLQKGDPTVHFSNELYTKGFYKKINTQDDPLSLSYYDFQTNKDHILKADYEEPVYKAVFCMSGYSANNIDGSSPYFYRANQTLFYLSLPEKIECRVSSKEPMKIAHLNIKKEYLERLFQENETGSGYWKNILHTNKNKSFHYNHLSIHKERLINDILTHTYDGITAKLFEEAKILELFACFSDSVVNYTGNNLSAKETEQLYYAKQIIDNSPTFITIKELSFRIGLNIFKLKSGFKLIFGYTIFEYQQDCHLRIAYNLILESTLSMQEIAERAGYSSLGSFSNVFLKKFNIRPSLLRK